MVTIGRNDPCPCGSGKKYKKCCLARANVISSEDFHYQRLSEAYNSLFEKLAVFCRRFLGTEAEDQALSEYLRAAGKDVSPKDEDIQRQMPLFAPWMVFNWEIGRSPAAKNFSAFEGKTVAEILLRDPAGPLDSLESRVAEAANRNPYRFFEVLGADPGKRVYLQDVLTGAEHTVQEKSGSQSMKKNDLLFGRVAMMGKISMFIGLAPYLIPPSIKVGLIELRKRLKAKKAAITEAEIRAGETEIRREFILIDYLMHHPPTVCNTDGDPLEPHKLVFEIDSPEKVLDELASLSVTESKEEILHNSRCHPDGGLQQVEWDWSRLGHKQSSAMSNTVLGQLTIEGNRLTVEVNSKKRAQKIRKTIEKRIGAGVRFKLDEITPFRPHEMWKAAQDPELEPKIKESLMQNPEVQRALAESMRSHWEGWVDLKLPALRGCTPREAVRTPDGREAVEALLADLERGRAVQPELDEQNRRGVQRVRELLGLPKKG